MRGCLVAVIFQNNTSNTIPIANSLNMILQHSMALVKLSTHDFPHDNFTHPRQGQHKR